MLREHISLRGIPLRVSDTAGLRESDNLVEKEGVRRAWDAIAAADVILYLVDSSKGLSAADRENIAALPADKLQLVYSKRDLAVAETTDDAIAISTLTGEGMEELIGRITGQATDLNQDNRLFMARRRHVDALARAGECVSRARQTLAETRSGELVAEDLRGAQRYLDEITGEFTSEDLLGKIFASFCVGK